MMPRCVVFVDAVRRKSASWVKIARPSLIASASCSSSSASSLRASWVVSTSTLWRRSPFATSGSTCSSRYSLMALAIALGFQFRWIPLPHLRNKSLAGPDRFFDFVAVIGVVCEGSLNIIGREVVFGGDLIRAQSHMIVPDCNVLHTDTMAGDMRLAADDAGCSDNAGRTPFHLLCFRQQWDPADALHGRDSTTAIGSRFDRWFSRVPHSYSLFSRRHTSRYGASGNC